LSWKALLLVLKVLLKVFSGTNVIVPLPRLKLPESVPAVMPPRLPKLDCPLRVRVPVLIPVLRLKVRPEPLTLPKVDVPLVRVRFPPPIPVLTISPLMMPELIGPATVRVAESPPELIVMPPEPPKVDCPARIRVPAPVPELSVKPLKPPKVDGPPFCALVPPELDGAPLEPLVVCPVSPKVSAFCVLVPL
jgi:hypothetical protein